MEVQILANELDGAKGKLSSMAELTEQVLKRAKSVYDEALDQYAEVNRTILPDLKLKDLQADAKKLNNTVSL